MITYDPKKPALYLSNDVYDSHVDGDPQSSVKIVPAVGSIVMFESTTNEFSAKVVVGVDPVTLDSTYGPFQHQVTDASNELINIGRDILILYYDTRQSPIQITPDRKIPRFGENSIGYRISRTNSDGTITVLSSRLDGEGNVVSNIIPITESPADHVMVCSTGHSLLTIVPGELLKMDVLDSSGLITMELILVAKEATILNTLDLASNPITGMDSDCSQVIGDDWVLYLGQDPGDLSIFPYVTYSDGTRRNVIVDNMSTYMYGYDAAVTNFPGVYDIVIKYFLGLDETSTIAQEVDGQRFITMAKRLLVLSQEKYIFSKISVLPLWDGATSKYDLRFIGYHETRNDFTDVTASIEYVTGRVYNPAAYNTQQQIQVTAPYVDEDGETTMFTQEFFLTVATPASTESFLIRSTVDGVAYGSDNALAIRPKLMYDEAIPRYFIPTSSFQTEELFLKNFYLNGSPPWLTSVEIKPPTPTHFFIRDAVSMRALLAMPVAVSDYENTMTLMSLTTPNAFVGSTVLFEWLVETSSGFNIIYGTPVEVELSDTGYLG